MRNGSHWFILVVPHITDAIQEWVQRVARVSVDGSSAEPDVCIIEVKLEFTIFIV